MLNEYEKKKLDIIKKIISKEITVKEAAKKINLSERQIYRLLDAYVKQ